MLFLEYTRQNHYSAVLDDLLEKTIQSGLAGEVTQLPPSDVSLAAKQYLFKGKLRNWIKTEVLLHSTRDYPPFNKGGAALKDPEAPLAVRQCNEALENLERALAEPRFLRRRPSMSDVVKQLRQAANAPEQMPILKTMCEELLRKIDMYGFSQSKGVGKQAG